MALLESALSLAQAPSERDALAGILRALSRSTPADALAVLAMGEDGALAITSDLGLSPAARRSRFRPPEHPRLLRAIGATSPIRFHDPREPDPYDGLLAGRGGPVDPIHACLAAPLYHQRRLVGVLTLDALDPRGLDGIRDDDVRVIAALAAPVVRPVPRSPTSRPPASREAGAASRLLGRSAAMARILREIEVLAPTPATVLVVGETGTGKELVARALHERGSRAGGPLVIVNCAALPAQLLESELFGHAKGAYTGAGASRAGRFEAAHEGTIFLDEIGELPLPAQAELLRTLQEGEIQRVGEDRPRRVDVRVIAATNRDLWRDAAEGRFRTDLLHRLWVYPIVVPPLRERGGDVALLAAHFIEAAAAWLGLGEAALHPEALARLSRYTWPGNVRELDHAVQRALLRRVAAATEPLRPIVVRPEDLELGAPLPSTPTLPTRPATAPASLEEAPRTLEEALEGARREAFTRAFQAAKGNAAEAARRLGLSRSFAYKEGLRLGLIKGAKHGRHR